MQETPSLEVDLASLLRAAQVTPHSFAEEIASSFRKTVEPAEVIVGISDQDGDVYRIKGTSGFPDPTSIPVEVARDRSTEAAPLAEVGATYHGEPPERLRKLFTHPDWKVSCVYARIEVPVIHGAAAGAQTPMLLVAIAHEDDSRALALQHSLEALAPFLALLYIGALNQQKLAAREQIIRQANTSKDASSLMHRACRLATELFHIEGAAALLPDDSRKLLELRAVYPRPRNIDRLDTYRLSALNQHNDPIVAAYSTASITRIVRNELPDELRAVLPGHCDRLLLLPLADQLGLVICAGKSWEMASRQQCGSFLWEDVTLLEFYADILTTLVRMLRGRDEASLRVERTLHGAKWIINDIRQNLSLLEENGVNELVPPILAHTLPNAIALLDDIASQLERKRLSSLHEIPIIDETRLFGDVLAGMAVFAPALSRALGRSPVKVNHLKDSTIPRLPVLRSNKAALVTVFRNLVHNAVKYSRRDRGAMPWLTFDGGFDDTRVWVAVSDNGLGIDKADYKLVFQEGYRGQRAKDVDPSGMGVGLSDCREILRLLGGSISIVEPESTDFGEASTTVRVVLPRRFGGTTSDLRE